MSKLTRDGLPKPSREAKFSDANGDREIFIFPVQLTTSRIGNLTRLIHTLAVCVTIQTYIMTRMTGPDYAVMCNLINTHTPIHIQ